MMTLRGEASKRLRRKENYQMTTKSVYSGFQSPIRRKLGLYKFRMVVPILGTLLTLTWALSPCNGQEARPLIEAAQNGKLAEVNALLAKGGDANAALDDGRTALMAASYFGHVAVAEALLKAKADVNKATGHGTTALMYASQQGKMEIVELLVKNGAKIDASNDKGETPLMKAAFNGYSGIVKVLVNEGADVNKVAANGATALEAAGLKGNKEIVELLEKAGAKKKDLVEGLMTNVQSKDKATRLQAIQELAFKKDARAIKPLLDVLRSETDAEVSERATFALGNITGTAGKDAVKPLLLALEEKDEKMKERAAWALSFARVKDQEWKDALNRAVAAEDLPVIVGAYSYLIRLGKDGSEGVLIKALEKSGSRMMASEFVHCGNEKLGTAGKAWLKKSGLGVSRAMGGISMGPNWGEERD